MKDTENRTRTITVVEKADESEGKFVLSHSRVSIDFFVRSTACSLLGC